MDKCYFCNQNVLNDFKLLSCNKCCFTKCHHKCFEQYENYLISLIVYPNNYSHDIKKELLWSYDFKLISNRIPCYCNKNDSFKPYIENKESLFYYGHNFNFAQHELKKN